MNTKIKIDRQPTMKDVRELKREVRSLRSFIISMVGEDKEGNYRPEFIKEILTSTEEKPAYRYTGTGSLLKQLKDL